MGRAPTPEGVNDPVTAAQAVPLRGRLVANWRKNGQFGPKMRNKWRNWEPEGEMGPALLPTPLSPPCGPCHELLARRLGTWCQACRLEQTPGGKPSAMSHGARVGAGSSVGPGVTADLATCSPVPCPSAEPRPDRLPAASSGTAGARRHSRSISSRIAFRPFHRQILGGWCERVVGLPLRVLPFRPIFHPAASAEEPFALQRHLSGSAGDPWGNTVSQSTSGECAEPTSRAIRGLADLSTFATKASGQGWISQRLVAEVA